MTDDTPTPSPADQSGEALVKKLRERADIWETIGKRHAGYADRKMVECLREAAATIESLLSRATRAEARAKEAEEQLRPGSPTERAPTVDAYERACAALHRKTALLEAAEAQRDEALEALEPFAKWATHQLESVLPAKIAADDCTPVLGDHWDNKPEVLVGDLRRAASVRSRLSNKEAGDSADQ